jgi:hypothetical protein
MRTKIRHDSILNYIRRQPVRELKRAAMRMEIIIRNGWNRRHLERALHQRVKSDPSPNKLMTYYLYK